MRIYSILIGVLFFGMQRTLLAQTGTPGMGEVVSLRAYFMNAAFASTSMLKRSDFASGFEFEYALPVSSRLDLTFPVRTGKAFFPARQSGSWNEGLLFSSEVQLHLRYYPYGAGVNVFLLGGTGVVVQDFTTARLVFPLGAGLDLRISSPLYFSAQGAYQASLKQAENQLVLSAGIKLIPDYDSAEALKLKRRKAAREDRDLDGVPDTVDDCPDRFGPAHLSGCPDTDSDGFPDVVDNCPDAAGPVQGCPDADRDGIPDKDDACPLEIGTAERNGCPIRDRDADGVLDTQDACPDEPGRVEAGGCPDQDQDGVADKQDDCPELPGTLQTAGCPDTDGDGVADKSDRCPFTAGAPDKAGCPDITPEEQALLDHAKYAVQFQPESELLKQASYAVLDQLVELMRKYPDFELWIRVHTDDTGSAERNQKRSEQRAKACYEYFISRGIGPRRLRYEGLGNSTPIADHKTTAGRNLNRRIEFLLSPRN